MSDADRTRPHLVAVGDAEGASAPVPPERAGEPESTGRGPLFWLLTALVVAAFVGLVVQTQRAGELQGTIEELEGELFTTRTALDAYEARFDEVRHSVGGLQAQLDQLNALVTADPVPVAPEATGDAPPPIPAESTAPAQPLH